jgi:hypothetical protein
MWRCGYNRSEQEFIGLLRAGGGLRATAGREAIE